MIDYKTLSSQPRPFLALTSLTAAESRDLLPAFEGAYDHAYPMNRTATGQPRQRCFGGGRRAVLFSAEDKLLFLNHLDRRLRARVDPSDVVQEVMAEASRKLPEYSEQ